MHILASIPTAYAGVFILHASGDSETVEERRRSFGATREGLGSPVHFVIPSENQLSSPPALPDSAMVAQLRSVRQGTMLGVALTGDGGLASIG